jgi:hypothetical protein
LDKSAFRCATLPLDPELVARHARDRKAAIAERDQQCPVPVVLIGPAAPPANVVGGFRFPRAAAIDLNLVASIVPTIFAPEAINITSAPDDLSIPVFLRRTDGAAESAPVGSSDYKDSNQ